MKRVIAALVASGAAVAALTITPTQHDFGDVGVQGIRVHPFHVTMFSGATVQDSIFMTIAGANAADFNILIKDDRECATPDSTTNSGVRPGACDVEIEFRPTSLGPKTARLQVADRRGGQVTALLKGKGVQPLCEMKVVSCNYAHMYSGSFSWQSGLFGPYAQNRRSITVTVVNGVATCDGSETAVSISDVGGQKVSTTEVGTIKGPGLIAVEFEHDSTNALVYNVTGACPSPQWQASVGRPVDPAELGNSYYEQSYHQPASATLIDLVGNRSEPHPDTDALNGVSGTLRVTWSLKRS